MFLKAASFLLALTALGLAVEIRVATFNIGAHLVVPPGGGPAFFDYGLGAAGTPDHDTVREILGRIDADVVALQEIHGADISAGDVSDLAASLGYPHVFLSSNSTAFDTSLRVIFLSRFPFLNTTSVASPAGARDLTRLIPAVQVDVSGTTRDPVLVAAHLKSGSAASDIFQRTVEMRRLTDHLTSRGLIADDNYLILGDFNLSDSDRTFDELPGSGLPANFDLGDDIVFPISYFTDPISYFSNPEISRIIPRQLDDSPITYPNGASSIDLLLASPIIASRPHRTEIYNSTLDSSNAGGLPKAGSPLAAGTSATASDHLPLFGDFELDPPLPYVFTAAGETVSEDFAGFPGTFHPYPWLATGGDWKGTDGGTSNSRGFRTYGNPADPSLGMLPGAGGGSATASFINQSTAALSALRISFTAEQWRSSSGGTADTLSAELIVDGVPQALPQLTFQAATDLPNGSIAGGTSSVKSIIASGLDVPPGESFELKFTFTPGPGGGPLPDDVFINEFHYDNAGSDIGEFVEVVTGPGFTGNLSDVVLLLYNGGNGTTYGSHALSTFTAGTVTASGHTIHSKLIPGIQNGNPDGFALVVEGVVEQFISYGGSFAATNGAASGMTSINIGVTQSTGEVVGQASLGLTGSGGNSSAFTWTKFTGIAHSPGQPNSGQTFTVPPQPQGVAIDNLAVTFLSDSDGDGFSDSSELIFGTNPQDAASYFTMAFAYPAPAPGVARLTFATVVGRNYAVDSSTDLSDWEEVAVYPGTGGEQMADFPVSPADPERFYRIRVTLAQ
jgi:hypothetical protein